MSVIVSGQFNTVAWNVYSAGQMPCPGSIFHSGFNKDQFTLAIISAGAENFQLYSVVFIVRICRNIGLAFLNRIFMRFFNLHMGFWDAAYIHFAINMDSYYFYSCIFIVNHGQRFWITKTIYGETYVLPC